MSWSLPGSSLWSLVKYTMLRSDLKSQMRPQESHGVGEAVKADVQRITVFIPCTNKKMISAKLTVSSDNNNDGLHRVLINKNKYKDMFYSQVLWVSPKEKHGL